jgi:copper(I)-binding protein
MKYINSLILVFLTLLALSACTSQGDLTVSDVWARPGIADGNTGVFFVIDNPTDQDDRLLSASSDVAQFVELHKTTMEDGVMQMMPQEFVPVPAGEQVVFKPGNLHVMLIKLHAQLNVGDTFDLTLVFENAGEIALTVAVQEQ